MIVKNKHKKNHSMPFNNFSYKRKTMIKSFKIDM